MTEFNASLVREKIIFVDQEQAMLDGVEAEPVTIRSNRIFLQINDGKHTEKIVVRCQNMHTTLRLASKIMYSFYKNGLFRGRENPYDWEGTWDAILPSYEKEFNPNNWAAVYINGQSVFKTSSFPFVDVIEKCALLTVDNYDATIDVTESALKQVGKAVSINHSSNVAAVFSDDGRESMRAAIIHRSERKDTNFTFVVSGGETHNRVSQTINIAAAFLEALNLRFVVRHLGQQKRKGELEKTGDGANKLRGATGRLVAINKGITSFEEVYEVKYRPEKPDFFGAGF